MTSDQPEPMREMDFGEFTRDAFVPGVPVRFRIPADFVAVSPEGDATRTYWTSPADAARFAADPDASLRDGFYSATISMNVGYDAGRDLFFGVDGDETAMKSSFEAQGYSGVSLERRRVEGYPVLIIEAEQDRRRVRVVYIATLIDTNVAFVFYAHGQPYGERDRARWSELRAGIAGSSRRADARG